MKYLTVLFLFAIGCKPIQQITPLSDTVRIVDVRTHYETEYVIKDSIKVDTFNNTILKTVFQTKLKTIRDTIYSDKEVIKQNPINPILQAENAKLLQKSLLKGRIMWALIVLITIYFVLRKIFK